jgi:uncharacterized membrane protein required for colicin V production
MSVVDIACLLILAVSILNGIRQGALRLVWSITRLVIAYVAAYTLARRVGSALHGRLVQGELYATILGGLVVFWGAYLLLELLAAALRLWRAARRPGSTARRPSGVDRLGGGLIGSVSGLVLVVVLCWLYQLALGTDWGKTFPTVHNSIGVRFS